MGGDLRTNRDKELIPSPGNQFGYPWQIKKKISHDEVVVGKLVIPLFETFEYILRYWTMDMAKSLVENGCRVCVNVWDVTEENALNKYEGESICLRKLYNDDFSLSCIELFNNHRLAYGDEIGLYWDPRSSSLMFKLLSQAGS